MSECETWLRQLLADGKEHLVDDVRAEAKINGFGKAELKAARKSLGVKAYHQFDGRRATDNWFWYREVK